jgi:polyphosphate kinase
VLKVNALVDPATIRALYEASGTGVQIDCIVRGMCSIRPGVAGLSETIRVRSVIGRYLEHSRILAFGTGERERFYIGSADIMERNLDRRVEAMTPVDDPALQARLRSIIDVMLADDRRAWALGADDRWRRVEAMSKTRSGVDTFATLADEALAASEAA